MRRPLPSKAEVHPAQGRSLTLEKKIGTNKMYRRLLSNKKIVLKNSHFKKEWVGN